MTKPAEYTQVLERISNMLHKISEQLERIGDYMNLHWQISRVQPAPNDTLLTVPKLPERLKYPQPEPDREQQERTRTNLDEELSDYAELLEVVLLEGKTCYALKEYDPTAEGKQRWVKINEIMKRYRGLWIPDKAASRWEVPT